MRQKKNNYRIALIHATPVSIDPIRAAFHEEWPDAETINLLDDALAVDLNSGSFEPDRIKQRIGALADYGLQTEADGILYTCSAFGQDIESVQERFDIPVLKPNEAMFEEALMTGGKIGMIATFKPSIPSMEKEFYELARNLNKTARINSIYVDEAMAALARGDAETHNRLIAEASVVLEGYQVVMLAQFSTSLAREEVEAQLRCTVLTSPSSAVRKLKRLLSVPV